MDKNFKYCYVDERGVLGLSNEIIFSFHGVCLENFKITRNKIVGDRVLFDYNFGNNVSPKDVREEYLEEHESIFCGRVLKVKKGWVVLKKKKKYSFLSNNGFKIVFESDS